MDPYTLWCLRDLYEVEGIECEFSTIPGYLDMTLEITVYPEDHEVIVKYRDLGRGG